MTTTPAISDIDALRSALQARFPLICMETHEEPRATALLEKLAQESDLPLYTWSIADGLIQQNFRYGGAGPRDGFQTVEGWKPQRTAQVDAQENARRREIEDTVELQEALHFIDKEGPPGLYLLFDPHHFLEQGAVQRLLREVAFAHHDRARTLVLIGPRLELPAEIARHALFHELALPDVARIRKIFQEELELFATSREGRKVGGEQAIANRLVQQLAGLCEEDVRRLLRLSIRDDAQITERDLQRVMDAKRSMQAQSALEVEYVNGDMTSVGGMPNLKHWLQLRTASFCGDADGLPTPRGVLLLGVQGGGKSLAARTIAASWKVPLARLDVGSLYDKYHGETERNLRAALAAAEALSPCVLWIDEIEKAMAQGSAESDGGVGRRVLGTLLTWMAERASRVFIAATANDVRALPAELLRKGRFDEIFFVDLPDEATRQDIFRIHLLRRQQQPQAFDLPRLASASQGFTGAEIEQAVIAASFEAHAQKLVLNDTLLLTEIGRTRPLSVLMAEQVQALRHWATERAVMA
ncbi:AAA family ATPase [Uliginosibacterium sp. H1]|uniref:AAA family ATPase n=1 Tax=Uliginosibacterium sp. H1 TaxID=3114757 RepID=UPI002E1958F7|nr:AAA family ATPase [Uliginosibacterium sp. H1]